MLFAVGLLLTVAAASLVPVPEDAREEGESAVEAGEPGPESGAADPVELTFSVDGPPGAAGSAGEGPPGEPGAPDEREQPSEAPTQTAGSDERVVVTVSAREPGEVALEGLGLVEPVGPGTPAVFDLFTDSTGEFAVLYRPVDGRERRVGTLAVVSKTSPESGRAAEPEVERE